MLSVGRVLFIWLLVLAVPVQGLAAALMVSCGSHRLVGASALLHPAQAGHTALADLRPGGVPAADADADGDDAAPPCPHHAQLAGAGVAGAGDAGMADAGAQPAHGNDHSCSACAACCSAGAPQSPMLAVPVVASPGALFAAVQTAVDGFAADGLERPPRAASA